MTYPQTPADLAFLSVAEMTRAAQPGHAIAGAQGAAQPQGLGPQGGVAALPAMGLVDVG